MGKKTDKRSSETKPKKNEKDNSELKAKMKKLEKKTKRIEPEEDSSEPDTSDFEIEGKPEIASDIEDVSKQDDEKLKERNRVAKMMTEIYDPEKAEEQLKCKISIGEDDKERIMNGVDALLTKSERYRDKLARRMVDTISVNDRHFYKKLRSLMDTMNEYIATLKILVDEFE